MSLRIQDEIIKRSLDFFGLRGTVEHDYEPTILPVVQIGDLGQRTVTMNSLASFTVPFPNVPTGKVWRPVGFSGRITQAGGTVAPLIAFTTGGLGNVGFIIPFFFAVSSAAGAVGPVLRTAFTLNTVNDVTIIFPPNLLIPAGFSFQPMLSAGDGTITQNSILVVHEIGEGLVALQ